MTQNNLVHRLFYTSEQSPNHIFGRLTGMQPSDGWLLLTETPTTITITYFLDSRYAHKPLTTPIPEIQSRLQTSKPLTLTKQLLDKTTKLIDHLPQDAPCIIEPSLPIGVELFLQKASIQIETDSDKRQQTKRMIKTPTEIDAMQEAIKLTKVLFTRIEQLIETRDIIGMTELQLRGMIIAQAMELGASDEAFAMIVASGHHTAIPHHRATSLQISPGPLLIDMGRVVDGYCSDMTRTYRVGDCNHITPAGVTYEQFQSALTTVQQAHEYGCRNATAGTSIADLCSKARELLGDYEQYFTHILGHGVGVAVHEGPAMHSNATEILRSGMAITIEPGVYVPSQFGIRREDIVFVA